MFAKLKGILMKTFSIKESEISKWHIIDAKDKTLGRLASSVSQILKGKHKPTYTPHMDMGDFVIIINASKIRISGNKSKQSNTFHIVDILEVLNL